MTEGTPIRIDEIIGKERCLEQLSHANMILNGLLALQFPLDQTRANDLISRKVITLDEYAKIRNAQSEDELSDFPGSHKVLMRIRTQRALLSEFGATLVGRGLLEGIPITLATRTFLHDDIQESIARNPFFGSKGAPLIEAAFALEENGGMIVFPSFDPAFVNISANITPDGAPCMLDSYPDSALIDLIKTQSTPIEITTKMIWAYHISPDVQS